MKRQLVPAVLVVLLLFLRTLAFAGETAPTYDLKVAFDIPHSRIIGTATIDTPKGTELSIAGGGSANTVADHREHHAGSGAA